MDIVELTPQEAAQRALRAGLLLGEDRHEGVAATARHMQSVIATLREIDFGDTPPAFTFTPEEETFDATV
ncbi:MAG TPA: hypothetical protein VFH94_15300 [Streptomyces sp.]|nr:hypothetical protein [Streptomyces sp.]